MAKDNSIREIMKLKATFISWLDLDFASIMDLQRRARRNTDRMPTRGSSQRQKQADEYRLIDEMSDRQARRVGEKVMEVYRFLEEHQSELPKGLRTKLFRKGD